MPVLIVVGLLLASAVTTIVVRYRRNPSAYAILGGTVRDRRALSIGLLMALAVVVANAADGESIPWALLPSAFIGFVAASIVHHFRTRRPI